jgi:hypothetical protein
MPRSIQTLLVELREAMRITPDDRVDPTAIQKRVSNVTFRRKSGPV